jgi:hypothetical protein
MKRNLVVNGDVSLRESGDINMNGGDINVIGGDITLDGSFTISNGTVGCYNTELDRSFKILMLKVVKEALNTSEPELSLMLTSANEVDRDYAKMIFDIRASLKDNK